MTVKEAQSILCDEAAGKDTEAVIVIKKNTVGDKRGLRMVVWFGLTSPNCSAQCIIDDTQPDWRKFMQSVDWKNEQKPMSKQECEEILCRP